MRRVKEQQEATNKADMKAVGNLRQAHPGWPVWSPAHGHPPGIAVGRTFVGRYELVVAGVHSNYMRGIAAKSAEPAQAVCVSGGYEDDDDHGAWLIYTGEGGRDAAGNQIADQQWHTGDNWALLEACFRQGKPVRVARSSKE